jgi:hypothetical protein
MSREQEPFPQSETGKETIEDMRTSSQAEGHDVALPPGVRKATPIPPDRQPAPHIDRFNTDPIVVQQSYRKAHQHSVRVADYTLEQYDWWYRNYQEKRKSAEEIIENPATILPEEAQKSLGRWAIGLLKGKLPPGLLIYDKRQLSEAVDDYATYAAWQQGREVRMHEAVNKRNAIIEEAGAHYRAHEEAIVEDAIADAESSGVEINY